MVKVLKKVGSVLLLICWDWDRVKYAFYEHLRQ